MSAIKFSSEGHYSTHSPIIFNNIGKDWQNNNYFVYYTPASSNIDCPFVCPPLNSNGYDIETDPQQYMAMRPRVSESDPRQALQILHSNAEEQIVHSMTSTLRNVLKVIIVE